MQGASESVAALAAALAKAQTQLVNPEKSLVATIRPDRYGGSERSFRYAPLAAGLEIIRKALGAHEIASVQTTTVDQQAGIVKLNTILAHSSGEWISSEWPVCRVADLATPQRMGTALTYARRYSLFTLVGIAGEDDLDAPDLDGISDDNGGAPVIQLSASSSLQPSRAVSPGNGRRKPKQTAPALAPEELLGLRARLLSGLEEIASADELTRWAVQTLALKNRLSTPDAEQIEAAFASKLRALNDEDPEHPPSAPATPLPTGTEDRDRRRPKVDGAMPEASSGIPVVSPGIVPRFGGPLQKLTRLRDKNHLRFVAGLACLVCGRIPSDPHHIRFAQDRALGRKVSDEYTVPLCRTHHRELHRHGNEFRWWEAAGIDGIAAARRLWEQTHSPS